MTTSNSSLYAAVFSTLLGSCIQQQTTSPDFFKIQGYSIYSDDKPGEYYVIHINDRTHYYFFKKLRDGNDLIIHDWEGDLVSDRVIVLSREGIIAGIDTKHLESEVVLKLDEMLLKAERKVIGKKL